MPVLLARPAFIRDVSERIAWLAENASEEYLDNFLAGLAAVRERIAGYPRAGAPVRENGRRVLRMRLFPRPLPYLVYYGHEKREPIEEIYLVRLFGRGQDRPDVSMARWPW